MVIHGPLDSQMPLLATAGRHIVPKVWPIGTSLTEGTSFGGVETGAWRYPFKQIAAIYGVHFDYVGTKTSQDGLSSDGSTIPPTGLWKYGVDREHDGNGGYTMPQIADVFVSNAATVMAQIGNSGSILPIIEFGANDSFLDGSGNPVGESMMETQLAKIAATAILIGNPRILFVGRPPRMDGTNNWIESYAEAQAQSQYMKQKLRKYHALNYPWHYLSLADSTMADHWDNSWHIASNDVHFNFVGYARMALEIWKACNGGFDPPKHTNPLTGFTKLTSIPADLYYPWGAQVTPVNAGDIIKAVCWDGTTITVGVNWPRGVAIPVPVTKIFSTGSTIAESYVATYAPGMLY